MSRIDEIAENIFKISTFHADFNLQFSQFLVRDEEPLLYHTGMKGLFENVRQSVAKLIDPAAIRWIGFSHFEADECGSLAQWQDIAPQATAVCSLVSKMVNVDDVVARRPARALADNEVLTTGKCRFRFIQTPHVPHAWDAGHLFEETGRTLLSSDIFHQDGDLEPVTSEDVVERTKNVIVAYQKGPLANYLPYSSLTKPTLSRLAALKPKTIAPMHGSAYAGDGATALNELAQVMEEVLG